MAQRCLTQLELELRTEQALYIGQRHTGLGGTREDRSQTLPGLYDIGHRHRALLERPSRLLQHGRVLLDHSLRLEVRNHMSVEVSQDLPLRDSQLHNVAHLTEAATCEGGQAGGCQCSRARIAPARQAHASVLVAAEECCHLRPESLREGIIVAAWVDEVRYAAYQQG
eukprot:CAMPEP_0115234940 /NCGR_PEP_ID=MMETSP0270-20121206/35049_1 /TAXON_ID=71861 /ORGANISM="Scrippsiella trochoidea, Strain CCMP3099" /LENGTH=167 /DNA_ID=CAMNT_0002649697 /DNA_START=352 /DNA_END=855 /DNA_ORIENTATION=+